MKNLILKLVLFIPIFVVEYVNAQSYNMSNGSISTCSGTFYDNGGTSNYTNSQNLTFTICPSTSGSKVVINFTDFSLENNYDFLNIYDGNSTAAPTLGVYTGTAGPGLTSASPSNTSGCLTFVFTSDGSFNYSGWIGEISCSIPCPMITSGIASTSPTAVDGIIKICPGESVSFTATSGSGGTGPYTYAWNFGDGSTASTQTASHTYSTSGSYQASLVVTDANGCSTTSSYTVIIQVATIPIITASVSPDPICLGQSADLTANVTMTPFVPNCSPPISDTTFLPDGSGVSYTTDITVNCFEAGQTITSTSDIDDVCLTLEHSYLGDLSIVLICPNGQSMILKAYPGGNGTYLGAPLDDPTVGPGTGRVYCFTPGASTLLVNGPTSSAGSPAGSSVNAGNYMPVESFTNLIGCPLNGDWTIQVTDNLGSDNGYIFNWDVDFTVPPATGSFTPTIASQGWNSETGLTSTGLTTATITPTETGTPCYTYTVVDDFGCTYTQNQCITVNANVPVNAGPDVSGCPGATLTIGGSPSGPADMIYSWVETGDNPNIAITSSSTIANPTVTISAGATGTATYTVTGTSAGCITTDVVTVTVVPSPITNAGEDQEVCVGGSVTLTATGATTYSWSPGTGLSATTGATVTSTPDATITYTVTGTTAGCISTDQVVVTVNSVVSANANIDQVVCVGGTITLAGSVGGSATSGTWSAPSGSFSDASSLTSSYTPSITSGTVTLTLTTNDPAGLCPIETDQMIVTVSPLATANANVDQTVCAGGTVTLAGSIGGSATSATWSAPSGSFSNSTSLTSTYTPSITSGTVTLTLTTDDPAGSCLAEMDQMVITVNTLPIVSAGPDVTICSSPSTVLTATGASTYTWSPATGLSGTTTASVTATPSETTTYTVSGTDAEGCINTDQVIVTVDPLPTVGAGVDQTICEGASVTLSGSGASTYSWDNGVSNGVAFSPTATTTFTVTGTSAAGCTNTDQVLVTVNPLPVVVANDIGVCGGGTVTLTATGADTYSWSPGTYLSATTGASVNSTPLATITYTVTGTSAAGCIGTDPITVTVSGSAAIVAGPDVAICIGGSTTLTATGGVTYSWDNGLGNGNDFSVSPTVTTTYTVIGTDAGGCVGTDAMTVTINSFPVVNAGLDQTVCDGASVTLTATGADTYSWDNGVTNGVAFIPVATNTYTVIGTTAAGCTNTDQVTVTVNPLPIVNAGIDKTVCAGTSVTLSGTGAATYSWDNGITNGTAFTPIATTTYTVTGTSAAGCINTDQVVVTVNPLPIVNAGIDQTVCAGATVTLNASGAATYTWNNGVTDGVTFTPIATTTYTVTGTDLNGCINTDQVLITVNPIPTVNAGTDQTVCIGTFVTLTATGASTYSWSDGITNGIAFTPSVTTTYTVTGMSAAGCINTDQVVVTVNPLPLVNAGEDFSICTSTPVTLSGTGASAYTWDNGVTDGVAFTPAATTTYTVTGTDVNGCVNTDAITVTVLSSAPINAGPDVAICIGSSTTLTATGGVNYTWDNSLGTGNDFSVSPEATTTYTVVGTDAVGCIGTDAITVTVTPLPIVNAGEDQTVCEETSVTLAATGADTYSWDNGVIDGVSFTPTVGTITYNVTGTTLEGCTGADQVIVTVNPLPIVNAGADQSVCEGTAVTLNGSGASTYTWTDGVINGVSFTPIATTTYTVTGTSAEFCTATDQVVVTVNLLPIVNAGADQTVCEGTSVTLTATGATTYSWDNGVTNGLGFTPAIGTITYTVTGTTGEGCIATDQVIVTVNPNPVPEINGPTEYCIGFSATLSTNNPFTTYNWSTGATTATINATIVDNPITVSVTNGFGCSAISPEFTVIENTVINADFTVTICQGDSAVIHGIIQTIAGTYSETFATVSGCDSVANVTLVVNPLPSVNAGVDQAVCTGVATTLTASGAVNYTWDNSVVNGVPFTQVIGTITYTVTGTDVNGCINTDQVNVTVNPLPDVNAGVDQEICIGASATLTGTGASTYTWNNDVTNGVAFTPAITNTYSVTGTDINGCINTDQVIVAVNPLPSVNAGEDQVTCLGGFVTLSGSGASTYTWDNGVINGVAFSPAATTTYTVTGTDVNGCINTDQVLVTVNTLPTVNAGPDQTVCIGTAVTLSGSGASTYSWDNGITNGIAFTPSVTTTYTVTGTSGANCIATDQVVVTVNPLPSVNAGVDQSVCVGNNVTLSGSGASTYTWNNGVLNGTAFTPTLTNTYTVTGTDVNGCVNTDQVIVTVNPLPTVNAGVDQTICVGESITLSGTGANIYTWDNGVTNGVAFAPAATNTYTVSGTDFNGCVNIDQVLVTVNTLPIVDAGLDQTVCVGTSVTLSGSGAITYSWNNNVNDGVAFIPAVGTITYTVTGTNGTNCFNTDEIVVTVNPLPVVNAGLDQAICIGATTSLTGSGASTYTWDNGVSYGIVFSPSVTNTYTVTGTDINGCINTDQVVITVNPLPVVNAGIDQTICSGAPVTLSGAGANTYSWDNGVTNAVAFNPTTSNTYTVTGTDNNGCTNTDQVLLTVNPLPIVSAGSDLTVCQGTAITLFGSGATTYTWDNGVIDNKVFTPSVGTVTYTVIGTDNNGCTNNDQVIVTVNPLPDVNAGFDLAICIGGKVILIATGAATYSWDNGVVNGIAFSPSTTTTYTVTGTSSFGCVNVDQVIVTVNPLPNVNAGNDFSICENESAILTGSGALIYTWDNGVINGISFKPPLGTITYTVTGTDANGCIDTDQISITVIPSPVVNFIADTTKGCIPLTVSFTNLTPNSLNCIWVISNGTVLTGCNTVVTTFTQPGCFDVTLTTSENGCTNSFIASNLICVEAQPHASFTTSGNNLTTSDTEVSFFNNSSGAISYLWNFGDLSSTSNEINPIHIYDESADTYQVYLVATSPLGCVDTAYSFIKITEELLFFVPNTFTPDQDDFNEMFQPIFTSGFDPQSYTMLIFNRWGEVIFETHNTEIGWTGSFGKNGGVEEVQDGTYSWKIEFKSNQNDEHKMFVGHVTIIR